MQHSHRYACLSACTLQELVIVHLFTCQNVLLASLLHRHNLTIGRCHLLAQALYGLVYKNIIY